MPKQKTHKGIKKRFRITGSGKVKRRKACRGHKLSHKGGKRRRQLRQDGVFEAGDAVSVTIRDALRPGM